MIDLYNEVVTREQALRSVRNQVFMKQIDVELSYNINKDKDTTNFTDEQIEEHKKKTEATRLQAKEFGTWVSVIDKMLAEIN